MYCIVELTPSPNTPNFDSERNLELIYKPRSVECVHVRTLQDIPHKNRAQDLCCCHTRRRLGWQTTELYSVHKGSGTLPIYQGAKLKDINLHVGKSFLSYVVLGTIPKCIVEKSFILQFFHPLYP